MANPRNLSLLLCLSIAASLAGCTSDEGTAVAVAGGGDSSAGKAGQDDPASAGPRAAREDPRVTLSTSLGEITVRLYIERAPRTVTNFLHYVEGGHYNSTILHHVEAGYVALGGGYTPDLRERPGRYPIPNEAANGLKNVRGTIAMARQVDSIDSSTCQFFINLADNPSLDHHGEGPGEYGYCVFGEVEKGLDVLDALEQIEVREEADFDKLPVETVLIESARRVR